MNSPLRRSREFRGHVVIMYIYNLTRLFMLTFMVFIGVGGALGQIANLSQPLVSTHQGNIQGIYSTTRCNRTIANFLGIPFAGPPIGNLRFANPLPIRPCHNGRTYHATRPRKVCPQIRLDPSEYDEDCLYLNLHTPKIPTNAASSLLPVMVFIHGGGFGIGNISDYDGTYLLDKDVVLVVPGYRLGAFGFMSAGDDILPGNYGLKDVVVALKWVQDNIAYFGGDPQRVTLFGQSSGAISTHHLALSQSTRGLIHRYILHSGSAYAFYGFRSNSTYSTFPAKLGKALGCPTNTSSTLVECLRRVNPSDIIAAEPSLQPYPDYPPIIWGPSLEPESEGAVLTRTPREYFSDVSENRTRIPWMAGVVYEESAAWIPEYENDPASFEYQMREFDTIIPYAFDYYDQIEDPSVWTAAIKKFYFKNDLSRNISEMIINYTEALSDSRTNYGVYRSLRETVSINPGFFYSFEYRGSYSYAGGNTTNYGATHTDDLLYIFHLIPQFGSNASLSESDHRMVDTMLDIWTSFAANGVPRTTPRGGTPLTWNTYSSAGNHLRIGNYSDQRLDTQYEFKVSRMQFWSMLVADSMKRN